MRRCKIAFSVRQRITMPRKSRCPRLAVPKSAWRKCEIRPAQIGSSPQVTRRSENQKASQLWKCLIFQACLIGLLVFKIRCVCQTGELAFAGLNADDLLGFGPAFGYTHRQDGRCPLPRGKNSGRSQRCDTARRAALVKWAGGVGVFPGNLQSRSLPDRNFMQ